MGPIKAERLGSTRPQKAFRASFICAQLMLCLIFSELLRPKAFSEDSPSKVTAAAKVKKEKKRRSKKRRLKKLNLNKVPSKKMKKFIVKKINKRHFFSALYFSKSFIERKTLSPKDFKYMSNIMDTLSSKVGVDIYDYLNHKVKRRLKNGSINLYRAHLAFEKRNLPLTRKFTSRIRPKSYFYAEAKYLNGIALNDRGLLKKATKSFRDCVKAADDWHSQSYRDIHLKYFSLLKQNCLINLGRMAFKLERYQESLTRYNKISLKEKLWPHTLIEKAWNTFHLGDYNRTLGLLVSYKSPLLKNFHPPEAEALRAISYMQLCLWSDALQVAKDFHQTYTQKIKAMQKVVSSFEKAQFTDIERYIRNKRREKYSFLDIIFHRKKRIYSYDLAFQNRQSILQELKYYEKKSRSLNTLAYRKFLNNILVPTEKHLREVLISELNEYIGDVKFFSKEMYSIQLEIISRKKGRIYDTNSFVDDRARGDFSNVNRQDTQYFYDFAGSFWADELGTYSFGLKSNCKKNKSKKRKTRK